MSFFFGLRSLGADWQEAFRKVEQSDKDWIDSFITEHWGSNIVVVNGCEYFPSQLEGFIASHHSEKIGLITYLIHDLRCEIITLNSIIEGRGIGSRLLKLTENEAVKNNCKSIWLITTNDNLHAIEFYQKLGYSLIKVHKNAVEISRELKPEIPQIGYNGIPITDELEFVKNICR